MNFSQDVYVNIIFWDNDKSLFTYLEDLKTAIDEGDVVEFYKLRERLVTHCETIFNGDEVIIVSPIYLWQFDYNITYVIDNQYVIDTNDNGPFDELAAGNDQNFDELPLSIQNDLVQKAIKGNPGLFYLMNDTSGTIQSSFSRFFYLIQQIWLKKLYLHCTQIPGCLANIDIELDIVSICHRLFRVALYNDTDANGLMDISFNTTANGLYYPYSSEAIIMLELVNTTGIIFGEPEIDETLGNEKILWNATIKDPNVRLNPYGQSSETGLLIDAPVVPMEDSAFGFTFKPKSTMSGKNINLQGIMKIDQMFGAINGTDGLKGIYENLDLAIIYFSDVFELVVQEKISASAPQYNATVHNDVGLPVPASVNITTSATKSLDFFIGTSRVAGLNLTSDKYSIGNENPSFPTHVAKGAVIPWGLYQFAVTQTGEVANQVGEIDWNLSASITHSTYFYEVCYPDYNGSKIVHDPTYIVYGDATYSGEIPGFELYNVIFSLSIIGCLVIFLRKKKANFKI